MIDLVPARFHSLDDPDSRRVVAALTAVGAGRSAVVLPAVDAGFRAELRAQLVAVAPRLVSEGTLEDTPARPAARRSPAPAPVRARTRPMTVVLGGVAVVVMGLGGATYLSRDALPGDSLYGLKRTAEQVDLSFSGNDLDRGHAQLVAAQTRVGEVASLLSRPQAMALGAGFDASGTVSPTTVALITSTLDAADDDTHQGVTTISDDAVSTGNTAGLDLVVGWAQYQRDRIDALVSRIPGGTSAASAAATSAAEIRAGLARAEAMDQQVKAGITCTAPGRDQFGSLPCGATPTGPGITYSPAPGGAPAPGTPGSSAPTGAPAPPVSTPATEPAATPTRSAAVATSAAPSTSASSPVVVVTTCSSGLGVGVGGIDISLGACPS